MAQEPPERRLRARLPAPRLFSRKAPPCASERSSDLFPCPLPRRRAPVKKQMAADERRTTDKQSWSYPCSSAFISGHLSVLTFPQRPSPPRRNPAAARRSSPGPPAAPATYRDEIGRASCRGRVYISVDPLRL